MQASHYTAYIAFQPTNTATLCHSVVEVAQHHCPEVVTQAENICQTFLRAFQLFQACHTIYDSKVVTDKEIKQLGKEVGIYFPILHNMYICNVMFTDNNIQDFMSYYRSTFPHASVTPKMHMLETHIVPWLQKWHIGFGTMGEQGIEGIHKEFNSLERTYHSIPDLVERMRNIMKEHLRHTAPLLQPAPSPKRQKRDREE